MAVRRGSLFPNFTHGRARNGCNRLSYSSGIRQGSGRVTDIICMVIRGLSNGIAGDGFQSRGWMQRVSRRALLAGAVAAACGRKRATRYQGWLFVASGGEQAVTVANLAAFRRIATIPIPHAPDQLFHSGDRVFATCREGQALIEIATGQLRVAGRIALPGKPVGARLLPGGRTAIVLTDEPAALLAVDLPTRRVTARLQLPAA